MDREKRRTVFERARERGIAIGIPMESDPIFVGWIEEWIDDGIDIAELRARYSTLLSSRATERRLARAASMRANLRDAISEVDSANSSTVMHEKNPEAPAAPVTVAPKSSPEPSVETDEHIQSIR